MNLAEIDSMRKIATLHVQTDEGARYEARVMGTNCPCGRANRVVPSDEMLKFLRGMSIEQATDALKKRQWRWHVKYA